LALQLGDPCALAGPGTWDLAIPPSLAQLTEVGNLSWQRGKVGMPNRMGFPGFPIDLFGVGSFQNLLSDIRLEP